MTGTAERTDVAVVGAGIGGLVAANELAGRGYRVVVIDAAERTGGVASRLELDGLALDAGAESFATRGGGVAELARELGLGEDIVDPAGEGAWLQLEDRAVPLPKDTLLGIPAIPLAKDVIAALGWSGALRAYADRLMPVLRIGKDEALGPLVERRMGRRTLERLVAPLAGGVYSADPARLDVATVAPGLNEAITRTGSLSGGVAWLREERAAGGRPGAAVQGIRGGIHRLGEALHANAERLHARFDLGARVESVERTETGWLLQAGTQTLEASALVVAVPEPEALRLLGHLPAFGPLRAAPGTSVELVTLVFDAGTIQGDPRGTGVLVASDVRRIRAKAMTHATAKWPWLREAAAGREIVRLSYGSGTTAAATAELDDADAIALALADASVILGIPLPQPRASARVRWAQGQPSSVVGAKARRSALRAAAEATGGLVLVGAAVAGTGLAQVVPDARRASLDIRREEFAVPGTPWTEDLEPADDASALEQDETAARPEQGAAPRPKEQQ